MVGQAGVTLLIDSERRRFCIMMAQHQALEL
jgi:hypothetical protein